MMLDPFDLDKTLSCGQVFRWRKVGEEWHGIISGREVTLRQEGCDLKAQGIEEDLLASYFRADDDLEEMCQDIMVSCGDERMGMMLRDQWGLRLVRQDPWECCASYILATFVHIPRIEQMIDKVCRTYGDRLEGGGYSFPRPEQISARPEAARACGLGFRCERFVEFARMVDNGEADLDGLKCLPYEECVKELRALPGIGDKVADCVALFSLGHLDAFPVDVRIKKSVKHLWGIEGNYRRVNRDCRRLFGQYAGYAQECIYLFMQGKTRRLTP